MQTVQQQRRADAQQHGHRHDHRGSGAEEEAGEATRRVRREREGCGAVVLLRCAAGFCHGERAKISAEM